MVVRWWPRGADTAGTLETADLCRAASQAARHSRIATTWWPLRSCLTGPAEMRQHHAVRRSRALLAWPWLTYGSRASSPAQKRLRKIGARVLYAGAAKIDRRDSDATLSALSVQYYDAASKQIVEIHAGSELGVICAAAEWRVLVLGAMSPRLSSLPGRIESGSDFWCNDEPAGHRL